MLSTRARRGATFVELIVTMIVGGIALTLITALCLREHRVFTDLAEQAAAYAQLRDAEAILPTDIRAASTAAGDLRDARDTSLELRSVVASGVVCDTAGGAVVLAPATAGVDSYAGISSAVTSGDTAWVLALADSTEAWRPFRVAASSAFRAGACAPGGPALIGSALTLPRTVLTLDSLSPATAIGVPLRITRPLRYSFYRGTDGAWYLGQRDWNTVTQRFNAIQPVSGPFVAPSASASVFHYLDTAGAALAVPVANARLVGAVRIDLQTRTASVPRALASAARRAPRADSAMVWILVRNRR
jgi:hypothetical protein